MKVWSVTSLSLLIVFSIILAEVTVSVKRKHHIQIGMMEMIYLMALQQRIIQWNVGLAFHSQNNHLPTFWKIQSVDGCFVFNVQSWILIISKSGGQIQTSHQ